jgi:hypothetical protein
MVEWCAVVRGQDPELDQQTARALADAIGELSTALRRCLETPQAPPADAK